MNDDITAQATASRQIAQRLRSCRRNCPTTAARRSAAPPAPNGVGEGSVQRSHPWNRRAACVGKAGKAYLGESLGHVLHIIPYCSRRVTVPFVYASSAPDRARQS